MHRQSTTLLSLGASIPASDPFRLTPLLLAKFKMDNLRPSRMVKDNRIPVDISYEEYRDLQSVIAAAKISLQRSNSR